MGKLVKSSVSRYVVTITDALHELFICLGGGAVLGAAAVASSGIVTALVGSTLGVGNFNDPILSYIKDVECSKSVR